jgi:hypothetical protein
MSEATILALITAGTSIVVALIQSGALKKQRAEDQIIVAARVHPPAQTADQAQSPHVEIKQTVTEYKAATHFGKSWIWATVVLCIGVFFLLFQEYEISQDQENIFGFLCPIISIGLAWFRPIKWGWATVAVGVWYGWWLVVSTIDIGYEDEEVAGVLIFYILNAIVVALVARYRERLLMKRKVGI